MILWLIDTLQNASDWCINDSMLITFITMELKKHHQQLEIKTILSFHSLFVFQHWPLWLSMTLHQCCRSFHGVYSYRVVFLTGPPDFQYQNEKNLLSFFTLKISWKTSPGWLQLVFHFCTENRADQLKNSTLYKGYIREVSDVDEDDTLGQKNKAKLCSSYLAKTLVVLIFKRVSFQMFPQSNCLNSCTVTLVAFVCLFSRMSSLMSMSFHMSPQMACPSRCIVA